MVELRPAPFADLVARMHLEPQRQNAIFDLPRRKWYLPPDDGPDLSVRFHGRPAGNPLGPASGPQTQMAQNIVLSWLAGGRIHELKTVQIDDRLTIPRPCIDATNVGYNIEWSQELRIAESLHEYVAGAMLVHMLQKGTSEFGTGNAEQDARSIPHSAFSIPHSSATIYDLSIGYDLKGIQSPQVVEFIREMKDAARIVDRLRLQIPSPWAHLRDLDYPTRLCTSITLSTFHGCPADEIERICAFLLSELDMDVVVKMNPPMLGREQLEHLLHDVLGYTEITVNPGVYDRGLKFDEALQLCDRLGRLAAGRGRRFGVKLSNTLEVLNHRNFFPPDRRVMYLSGPPLHVITLTLADLFRQAVGPELPISFSAGVDRHNFANMVACGFCPITTCTDLLKPGGYARLPAYLEDLARKMRRLGARTIDDFILLARGQRASCEAASSRDNQPGAGPDGAQSPPRDAPDSERHRQRLVRQVAAANLRIIAEETRQDERYRAENNRTVPRRIGTHLLLFDCVSCDRCIPVCPNDANFVYELPIQQFEYCDWVLHPDGRVEPGGIGVLEIERQHQIANFADFCNECGNCDTFCPEYGGPFIRKPTFFGTREGWEAHRGRDGFFIGSRCGIRHIFGRIQGRQYCLWDYADYYSYSDGTAIVLLASLPPRLEGRQLSPPLSIAFKTSITGPYLLAMRPFHILRLLLEGVGRARHVNPVSIGLQNV